MSGRKLDPIWVCFERIETPGKAGCKAKCKNCAMVLQGLVARMKKHNANCVDEEQPIQVNLSD